MKRTIKTAKKLTKKTSTKRAAPSTKRSSKKPANYRPTKWERIYGSRLLHLADFLETVPKKQFELGEWTTYRNIHEFPNGVKVGDCGTTACAMGWATTLPRFRKLGLRLVPHGGPSVPSYKKHVGMGAAKSLFDINFDQADLLFAPVEEYARRRYSEYSHETQVKMRSLPYSATPHQVAVAIRIFVERKSKFEQERRAKKATHEGR